MISNSPPIQNDIPSNIIFSFPTISIAGFIKEKKEEDNIIPADIANDISKIVLFIFLNKKTILAPKLVTKNVK